MHPTDKTKLLWIAVKLFDKSVDKATWLEMMANLCHNFDVSFLTGWRNQPLEIMLCGRPIEYFPQFGSGLLRKFSRHLLLRQAIKRHITRLRPNIIILNCNKNPAIIHTVAKCSQEYGCMVILDIRTLPTVEKNDTEWKLFAENLQIASRDFDGITYITDEMRRFCLKTFALPPHSSTIWSSGVNADLFQPFPDQTDTSDNTFRLIYHGGIISVGRGLDRLIQAIDLVRDLDVHLSLISSLREPEAIKWIDRLNLQDRVTLKATIPHARIPEHIQQSSAGILPFPDKDVWNTSSPIKLFEYLACGKPVIVSDIPAHRNVLQKAPFAFYAANSSPKALADAIRRAYTERSHLAELGRLARQQILERHTWTYQAKKLEQFLKNITVVEK